MSIEIILKLFDGRYKTSLRKQDSDKRKQATTRHRQRNMCSIVNYLKCVYYCVLILPSLASSWIVDFNEPTVHTQYGTIRGKIDERKTRFNRRPICTFLSIPYARPPVGSNRFSPPLEPDAWTQLEAYSKRVMCPQVEQRFRTINDNILESEDCLYLNVFVPVDRATPVVNYPVIVYIHGGEFKYGSKDHYSPEYLLDHGVILVTINYRLGPLGFLSTDDLAAPGNVGLYDQIAALRWVKRNIQSFGGNNDDVTVMGHDAGAISASLLLLAPHETKGLIHKVIAIGGSAFSPAAFHWNPRRQAHEFARELRCPDTQHTDQIIRCLRLKDWRVLMATSRLSHNYEQNTHRLWFRPVLDRNSTYSLLRDLPHALYAQGNALNVPLMMGVAASEGTLEVLGAWRYLRRMGTFERMRYLIRPYLYEFARAEILATALEWNYVKRYVNSSGNALSGGTYTALSNAPITAPLTHALNPLTGEMMFVPGSGAHVPPAGQEYDILVAPNDVKSKVLARTCDAIGDFLHVAPVVRQLELHAQLVGATYAFVFDYRGQRSFGHVLLEPEHANDASGTGHQVAGALVSTHTTNYGVAHGDDLFYLMPNAFGGYYSSPFAGVNTNFVPNSGAASSSVTSTGHLTTSPHQDQRQDDNVVRNYVTYLCTFVARFQNAQAANNLAHWVPFRHTDRQWMRFSESVPQTFKNFHQLDVSFVNEFVSPLEELVNTPLPLFPYEDLRDYQMSTWALAILLALILLTLAILACVMACVRRRARRRTAQMQQLVAFGEPSSPPPTPPKSINDHSGNGKASFLNVSTATNAHTTDFPADADAATNTAITKPITVQNQYHNFSNQDQASLHVFDIEHALVSNVHRANTPSPAPAPASTLTPTPTPAPTSATGAATGRESSTGGRLSRLEQRYINA
ncbi:Neuroligin-4, Y-linked [Fragariocoptes setiger]|uniref:Neuroligin-4, Y-linked n=1 Tax=Fragariocoptes setiger TaxID=1670756 RepID=A0ABQ7SA17_9ACAR|nr:Neuroligin-4, Y-linked [Fragariocoptes setiger]